MTTPAFVPSTIAIDNCDTELGEQLANALADLGAIVLLTGRDQSRLEHLQQSIAARWGHAKCGIVPNGAVPTIAVVSGIEDISGRVGQFSDSHEANGLVIIAPERQGKSCTLDALLSDPRNKQKVFVILLKDQSIDNGLDCSALAATCAFLLSSTGQSLENSCLQFESRRQTSGDTHVSYPEVNICAPALRMTC